MAPEQIKQKISELETELNALITDSNRHISYLSGKIDVYREMLKELENAETGKSIPPTN